MLYTLPTHNIQMQTPLCADIMSYYKKKSPRLDLPIQQANGIDNYTLSTNPSDAQRARLQSQRADSRVFTRLFKEMLPKT